MSKDNVKKLFGKIEKDAELQKKYASLMQAHQKETEKALSDKLIEFGRTSGFAFSKDDLLAARAELIEKANSNKELSDGDLTHVAGGVTQHKAGAIVWSVMTAGIGCAVVSCWAEAKKSGGCSEDMTVKGQYC